VIDVVGQRDFAQRLAGSHALQGFAHRCLVSLGLRPNLVPSAMARARPSLVWPERRNSSRDAISASGGLNQSCQ
jgi:hypothetical protein